MARILFVKPARLRSYSPAVVPPLGLLYLASVLRERGRHQVQVLDCRLEGERTQAVVRRVQDFEPDVVGLSVLTFEMEHAAELVNAIRAVRPHVPIVVGGPHPTAVPLETLSALGADAVVVGEGEEVITPLVEALAARETPDLPGVVTARHRDGAVAYAPVPDLDRLPLPAWDLVDFERYARFPCPSPLRSRFAVLITSRGCPWQCTFCHRIHGKRHRRRGLASVAAEIAWLQKLLGHGLVEVHDDTFNHHADHAKGVLKLFCETDGRLRPSFPNGLRSDRLDDEILDLMVQARTPFASLAVESGSPVVQKAIGKHLDLERAARAIESAAARRLFVNGFFMLGFPQETLSQMLETIRFSLSVPLAQALFLRVTPMPGTVLWASLPESVRRAPVQDYYSTRVNVTAVSDVTLEAVWRLAYISFYGRPSQVARLLKSPQGRYLLSHRLGHLVSVFASRYRRV